MKIPEPVRVSGDASTVPRTPELTDEELDAVAGGTWSGYWTWDAGAHEWTWTWVLNNPAGGFATS